MAILEPPARPRSGQTVPVTPFDTDTAPRSTGSPGLRRRLLVMDAAALFAGWAVVLLALQQRSALWSLVWAAAATVMSLSLFGQQGLYLARVSSVRTNEMARVIRSVAVVGVLIGVGFELLDHEYWWVELVLAAVMSMNLVLMERSVYRVWLSHQRSLGRYCRDVVLVGANREAAEIAELLDDHPELGLVVKAVVGDPTEAQLNGLSAKYVGDAEGATAAVRAHDATGAIVAVSALDSTELNQTIRSLMRAGAHVQVTSALRGIDHRRLRAQPVAYEPLFYLEPARLSPWQLALKRAIDLSLAVSLLLVTSPLIAILATIVKVTDRGPVLFRQKRVGRHGKSFDVLKIRTMVPDAEQRKAELVSHNERTGPLFKMDSDPRFTRVGRFMDVTSLNELPQLWNVARGEMSLVGPRPALPDEVAEFDDALQVRDQVRPGITGLWQVEGRDNPAFSVYRRLDLFYVENWSVTFDVMILIATGEAVLAKVFRAALGRSR